MPSSLTFTKKDILNSLILGDHGGIIYTTQSLKGFRGRKVTSLIGGGALSGSSTAHTTPPASIQWRKRLVDINGQVKHVEMLKRRSRGWFSSARLWQWGDMSYELHFSSGEWTARSSDGNTVATFFPYQPRLFHKSEQAQIFLLRDLSPTETAFLIVVFIYMELRRQDKQRSSSAASAGAAAGAGGGGGGGGC
ncbi:uncharacterized protein SCHCODRAFT_02608274 [Schizophyllum commune H4-8]|nr:uncharacterized protein SCHCODRAFT_02608274 [Schizophyllum commune H4-8]KAI5900578.1 hypothetical protein SCHCODRAFT_02608274 [Schizophyllum commune H4-8]